MQGGRKDMNNAEKNRKTREIILYLSDGHGFFYRLNLKKKKETSCYIFFESSF